MIDLTQACIDFYAIQAVDLLNMGKKKPAFTKLKKDYTKQLGLAMRDYLVLACAGEARHAKSSCTRYITEFPMKVSRDSVWSKSVAYSPIPLMKLCSKLFNEYRWAGGYGGKKWGQCADAFLGYYDKDNVLSKDAIFVDYCFDLQHNNGTVFNKGANIFMNVSSIQSVLNTKRDNLESLFSCYRVSPTIIMYMGMFDIEGFQTQTVSTNNSLKNVLNYNGISWGTAVLKGTFGSGSYSPHDDDDDEENDDESETETEEETTNGDTCNYGQYSSTKYSACEGSSTRDNNNMPFDDAGVSSSVGQLKESNTKCNSYNRAEFIAHCIKRGIR